MIASARVFKDIIEYFSETNGLGKPVSVSRRSHSLVIRWTKVRWASFRISLADDGDAIVADLKKWIRAE